MDDELEKLGTGSEEDDSLLDANTITEVQYNAIMTEACSQLTYAADTIGANLDGAIDYSKANESTMKLIQQLSSGRFVRLLNENKWLLKVEQSHKFCNSGKTPHEEVIRKVMVDNLELLSRMDGTRKQFIAALTTLAADLMRPIYKTIRFYDTMDDLIGENVPRVIENGFREYSQLAQTYTRSDVYDFLHINKTYYTKESAIEWTLDHIDGDIDTLPSLKALLTSSNQNLFYCIDRETKQYRQFAGRQSDMENLVNTFKEIRNSFTKYAASSNHGDMLSYFSKLDAVLESLIDPVERAIQIIKDFKEKSESPYCIMKYPDTVKNVYHLQPDLPDPLQNGTNYCNNIKKMIKTLRQLAVAIWNAAPQ